MTIKIDVRSDVKEITRYLNRVQKKQIPFATALALTKVAQDAKKALRANMGVVFDRPTRFTLNSLFVKPAKKKNPISDVRLKDFAGRGGNARNYLAPEIQGGARPLKRFEKHLQRRGFLPKGMYVVPSKTQKLNKSGNVTLGQINKILSGLGAQFDPKQNSRDKAQKVFFVANINGAYGIWRRMSGNKIKFMFAFVKVPRYRGVFKFDRIARKIGNRMFKKRFEQSLRKALATAR